MVYFRRNIRSITQFWRLVFSVDTTDYTLEELWKYKRYGVLAVKAVIGITIWPTAWLLIQYVRWLEGRCGFFGLCS